MRPRNLSQWILKALNDGPKTDEYIVEYVTRNGGFAIGSVYQRLHRLMYTDIIMYDQSDETGHTYKKGQQPQP